MKAQNLIDERNTLKELREKFVENKIVLDDNKYLKESISILSSLGNGRFYAEENIQHDDNESNRFPTKIDEEEILKSYKQLHKDILQPVKMRRAAIIQKLYKQMQDSAKEIKDLLTEANKSGASKVSVDSAQKSMSCIRDLKALLDESIKEDSYKFKVRFMKDGTIAKESDSDINITVENIFDPIEGIVKSDLFSVHYYANIDFQEINKLYLGL
jgi:hypothetical protein